MPSDKRARQRAGRAARMAELQKAQQRRRRNTRTIPIVAVILAGVVALILVTGLSGSSKKKTASTTTVASSSTTVSSSSTTASSSSTTASSSTPPTAAAVTTGTKITGTTPCPSFSGSSAHVTSFAHVPPLCITKGGSYGATISTNVGNVGITFDTTKTPNTANNFIVLALYHYFDSTALFRTDTSIGIIQGGSPHTQSPSDPGPGYTITDEGSGFSYAPGDLVMARTSSPNSAGSQFFFCVTTSCASLNSQGTYVVFAHVTTGLDVLQNILNSNVDEGNGLGGAPAKLTLINSITVTKS